MRGIRRKYEEVCGIVGYSPPKYCNKCGIPLQFWEFYDSLNRYTLKAFCEKCHDKWAISINRKSYEEKMLQRWAERVKERDGNVCRMCDENCFGSLHAHHIIPKGLNSARAYDVDNGITLCEFHHKQIHSFM